MRGLQRGCVLPLEIHPDDLPADAQQQKAARGERLHGHHVVQSLDSAEAVGLRCAGSIDEQDVSAEVGCDEVGRERQHELRVEGLLADGWDRELSHSAEQH